MNIRLLEVLFLGAALLALGALAFALFSGSDYSSQAFVAVIVLVIVVGLLGRAVRKKSNS
jgi:uncharacterized membrane protein YwzB